MAYGMGTPLQDFFITTDEEDGIHSVRATKGQEKVYDLTGRTAKGRGIMVKRERKTLLPSIKYFYPGHYWGDNLETPQRVEDVAKICEGILSGELSPTPGDNKSLPNIVNKYGVKVNYGKAQMR